VYVLFHCLITHNRTQRYISEFAAARDLPDQPGTCDWLLDPKVGPGFPAALCVA
jgi:hypothetical protein